METNLYSQNDFRCYQELAHSGRLGQKWGVKHGPPYPLDERQLTGAYKKNGGLSESAKEKYGHGGSNANGRTTQGRKKTSTAKRADVAKTLIEDYKKYYNDRDWDNVKSTERIKSYIEEVAKSPELVKAVEGYKELTKIRDHFWHDEDGAIVDKWTVIAGLVNADLWYKNPTKEEKEFMIDGYFDDFDQGSNYSFALYLQDKGKLDSYTNNARYYENQINDLISKRLSEDLGDSKDTVLREFQQAPEYNIKVSDVISEKIKENAGVPFHGLESLDPKYMNVTKEGVALLDKAKKEFDESYKTYVDDKNAELQALMEKYNGRQTSGKGFTKAQKAIEDENRKYSSATAEMEALTADCWHPESVDWREMIKGESKDAKRAIAAADLGLKAIEKLRGPGYIDDDETFTKELMTQEGYSREKAEKIAKNSNREWFLYEDQTIGLPTIADLVNQGYTPKQFSKLADRVNRRADDYYDELDSSSSIFTTKTERDVFCLTDSSWNDENKKFAEACYEIKNGNGSGRSTRGFGDAFNKNTIQNAQGPRQRGESNAEYEQRKDMLKDATKSLINNNTKTAAQEIGQRNRDARDAAKLERRIDKLAGKNIGGIYDKKIRELAATRDMKIEKLTREEIDLARKQLQNSRNIKIAALGGVMIGLTTGTPVTTAAAFAVGSAVINKIIDGGSTSKLQDKVNHQHSDIAIRREVERGRALPNWAEQRANEIGAKKPAKQPKLSDQAWDRAYASLQKKLERIDYDGDKLNVATLSPEEQQVYYEVISR